MNNRLNFLIFLILVVQATAQIWELLEDDEEIDLSQYGQEQYPIATTIFLAIFSAFSIFICIASSE